MDLLEKARQKLEEQKKIPQKIIELPPDKTDKQIIEESIKAHHEKKKLITDRKMNKVRLRQYLIKQLNANLDKFPIEFLQSERITYEKLWVMQTDEKILLLLQDLGLTRSEARVYIALVARGVSVATDIVRDAKVPHPRIYDIIANLMTKGLVEIQTGKRRKYKATKPSVAFARLMNRFREKGELVTQYMSKIYNKKMEIPSIWMLKGRDNVIDKILEILYKAENEVLLSIPANLLGTLEKHLRKVESKGVVTSLVIYLDGGKSQVDTKIARYADVRVRESPASILTQADFNECLLCSYNTLTSQPLVGEGHAIVVGDFELLQILSYFFYHSFWIHSKPLIQETPTRKYPRSFVHMWKAIEEVDMLMKKGYKVKTLIKGKNVIDHTPTEFEALIIETRNINERVFSLIVEKTDGTKIAVGGREASIEDVEATNITLIPIE